MSLRQVRLNTLADIKTRLQEFPGKKINIVLRTRKVLFGKLVSVDDRQLIFADMRQKKISLLLEEISEVYLDFKE
jgi:ribosome maturation factor RimP